MQHQLPSDYITQMQKMLGEQAEPSWAVSRSLVQPGCGFIP